MITQAAIYPLIGGIFLYLISGIRVIADENPYDEIDTTEIVSSLVEHIMIFTLLSLLALTIIGIIQVAVMLRARTVLRRKTLQLYKSVGMSEVSVKKVIGYERQAIIFHSLLYILFAIVIVAVVFSY